MLDMKIDKLIEQLNLEHESSMRMKAARELGRLPEAPLKALPDLIVHLSDEDHMVQKACIVTLGRIAQKAPGVKLQVMEAITPKLKDADKWTRYWTANWLVKLQVKTTDILLALLKCLDDSDDMILRKSAAETLADLSEHKTTIVPELEKVHKNDHQEVVRKAAKEALLKLRN
jgi:HEAT repeat protein